MRLILAIVFSLGCVGSVADRRLAAEEEWWTQVPKDNNGSIILTSANCGYLRIVENWIYHVRRLGISNWAVVCDDLESYEFLGSRYPGHVLRQATFHSFPQRRALGKYFIYGSTEFKTINARRAHTIADFLRHGLTVHYMDSDTALLRVPEQRAGYDLVVGHDLGVCFNSEMHEDGKLLRQFEGVVGGVCACNLFAYPTDATIKLMHEWSNMCRATGNDDQDVLKLIFPNASATYLKAYVEKRQYPSGWQVDNCGQSVLESAAWIHANWLIGYDKKVEFLKRHGGWEDIENVSFPVCV